MKTPQVEPAWRTGIYLGNGVVARKQRAHDLPTIDDGYSTMLAREKIKHYCARFNFRVSHVKARTGRLLSASTLERYPHQMVAEMTALHIYHVLRRGDPLSADVVY